MDAEKVAELRKKRAFRKFTFRGIELNKLLDLTNDELSDLAKGNATVLQVCLLLWLDIRVPVTRDWIRYSTPSGLGANT